MQSTKHLKDFDDKLRYTWGDYLIAADETARGCWISSLVAAAVCLPKDFFIEGLTDSKKLSRHKREEFASIIQKEAIAWSICHVEASDIDLYGITWANIKALEDACLEVKALIPDAGLYILDQSPCKTLNPCLMIPKADSTSLSVAAASIIAKVFRDELIDELHEKYPQYEFDKNHGYINQQHVNAVKKYGVIKGVHRESYIVKGYNKSQQLNLL